MALVINLVGSCVAAAVVAPPVVVDLTRIGLKDVGLSPDAEGSVVGR